MAQSMFEVHLPNSLSQYGFDQKEVQQRFVEWLVLSIFVEGRVSSGKASQLLNISRIEFLDLLRKRGLAYVNYTPEELKDEFAASKALKSTKSK